jgi:hypothetical protein
MHPGDNANAIPGGIGLSADGIYFLRAFDGWFKYNVNGYSGIIIDTPGNFFGMGGYLLQGFIAVKVLAAGYKPKFQMF